VPDFDTETEGDESDPDAEYGQSDHCIILKAPERPPFELARFYGAEKARMAGFRRLAGVPT
jgi:hypothetical protein